MGGQISSICLSPYFSCLSMQVCPVPWIYHRRHERAGKLQHLIYITADVLHFKWRSDTEFCANVIVFYSLMRQQIQTTSLIFSPPKDLKHTTIPVVQLKHYSAADCEFGPEPNRYFCWQIAAVHFLRGFREVCDHWVEAWWKDGWHPCQRCHHKHHENTHPKPSQDLHSLPLFPGEHSCLVPPNSNSNIVA